MIIQKFGGTSVGSAEQIKEVFKIVDNGQRKIIVLSAISGTTNLLVQIINDLKAGNFKDILESFQTIKELHLKIVKDLFERETDQLEITKSLNDQFLVLVRLISKEHSLKLEKEVLSFGEILSTRIFCAYCKYKQIDFSYIPALSFMSTDKNNEPDYKKIENKISKLLDCDAKCFVTEGYICLNCKDECDNLGRGGSDYTATIIGNVVDAERVDIWTDVDGIFNTDPRYVENSRLIPKISYKEAGLFAYYGAKILHPKCVQPLKHKNIPIRIRNTFSKENDGTEIIKDVHLNEQTLIATKDYIRLITIECKNSTSNNSFLANLYKNLSNNKVDIDMISIAFDTISIAIDELQNIDDLIRSMEGCSNITIENKYSIISVFCNNNYLFKNLEKFSLLNYNHLKMTSQKVGEISYSFFLVSTEYKSEVLKKLNNTLNDLKELSKV